MFERSFYYPNKNTFRFNKLSNFLKLISISVSVSSTSLLTINEYYKPSSLVCGMPVRNSTSESSSSLETASFTPNMATQSKIIKIIWKGCKVKIIILCFFFSQNVHEKIAKCRRCVEYETTLPAFSFQLHQFNSITKNYGDFTFWQQPQCYCF